MVDEYNVQPYNDGRTEKNTESLLTFLDYHNFFGNIIVYGDERIRQ